MSRRARPLLVAAALTTAAAASAAARPQTPEASPPPPASGPSAPVAAAPPPNSVDIGPPPEEAPPPPPVAADRPARSEAAASPAPESAPAPKPPEPMKRTRHDAAILQATDKITAETLRFQAKVGAPLRYKDLVITVRACETTAPDEAVQDSIASLDVVSQPLPVPGRPAAPVRQVYRGWMFASSPSLHPFSHPVYDLWLIACRTTAPVAAAGKR